VFHEFKLVIAPASAGRVFFILRWLAPAIGYAPGAARF